MPDERVTLTWTTIRRHIRLAAREATAFAWAGLPHAADSATRVAMHSLRRAVRRSASLGRKGGRAKP